MRVIFPIFTAIALFHMGCASKPVQETNLFGYEKGTLRMKYNSKIFNAKLENGESGYRLANKVNYSLGAKNRREYTATTIMDQDFHLMSMKISLNENEKKTETTIWFDEKLLYGTRAEGSESSDEEIPFQGTLYGDVHPLLYTRDLNLPGKEKAYQIVDPSELRIKELTVKFIGGKSINLNEKPTRCLHYQIESSNDPTKFNDYFLDPQSKSVIRIDYDSVQFVQPVG